MPRRPGSTTIGAQILSGSGPVTLRVEVEGFRRRFYHRRGEEEFQLTGEIADARFLSDEGVIGEYGFTGTLVGLYACCADVHHRMPADFSRFEMRM